MSKDRICIFVYGQGNDCQWVEIFHLNDDDGKIMLRDKNDKEAVFTEERLVKHLLDLMKTDGG